MQLDPVGGDAGLPMQKIKHTHALNLDRDVGRLEKLVVAVNLALNSLACIGYARQKRTARADA